MMCDGNINGGRRPHHLVSIGMQLTLNKDSSKALFSEIPLKFPYITMW